MRHKLFLFANIEMLLCVCLAGRTYAAQNTEMLKIAAYLAGIAKTHYCACHAWPQSLQKLKEFDDNLHAYSIAQKQKPVQRLPWDELSQSRYAIAEGSLKLEIRLASNSLPVEMPQPNDCESFNTKVFEILCTRPERP